MKTVLRIIIISYLVIINVYAALEMVQDKRTAEYNGLVMKYLGNDKFNRLRPITYAEFQELGRVDDKAVKIMRTPEKLLFNVSLAGGAIGIETAMYYLRHKTSNSGFTTNIPVHIGINLIIFGVMLYFLRTPRKRSVEDYSID